jgi:hypothetical protein
MAALSKENPNERRSSVAAPSTNPMPAGVGETIRNK